VSIDGVGAVEVLAFVAYRLVLPLELSRVHIYFVTSRRCCHGMMWMM